MKIKQKVLDNLAKALFVLIALLCIIVPSYEYYKIHNYPTRYTVGYVIGPCHMCDGDPSIDFFYLVKGRIIQSSSNEDAIKNKKFGDEIIVKYVYNDPEVSSIVRSVRSGDILERPYVSDSLKFSIYYGH